MRGFTQQLEALSNWSVYSHPWENDTEHDGSSDFVEFQNGSDPFKEDTDGDGFPAMLVKGHGKRPIFGHLEATGIVQPRQTIKRPLPTLEAMTKAGAIRVSRETERFLADNPSYRELAEAALEDYVQRLRRMDELTRKSKMTEAKAIELGRKARKGIRRRITQG